MICFTSGQLLLAIASLVASAYLPIDKVSDQKVLLDASTIDDSPRKLQGRFLHITDIHPDPFYKIHTIPDGDYPCHAGSGSAGYYGAEISDCDSPFSLVNATFQWIKENLKDDIDFVIWTGDSARHDNDEDHPRTEKGVIGLNKYTVTKFVEVFGKSDFIDDPDPTNDFIIPIVPTFGNNDILPHNIFLPGPNKWTKDYLEIWEKFVPEEQRHSFARGGWFFTEVIPNRLAVFSLNTLYFFDSNSAVDGCDLKSEPGYEHMEWLRIQLQFLRKRGMKAILIGHVPPARTESKQSWDESCYQKYTLWLRQYRDVVISSIFGHMNLDHFMFQDVKDLRYNFDIEDVEDDWLEGPDLSVRPKKGEFTIAAKATYLNELRDDWSNLPKPPKGSSYLNVSDDEEAIEDLEIAVVKKRKFKKRKRRREKFLKRIGGHWGERFSVSLVSPSVVPNFFPTLRVIEYNITGLEKDHPAKSPIGKPASTSVDFDVVEDIFLHELDDCKALSENISDDCSDVEESTINDEEEIESNSKKKEKESKKKKKKKSSKKPSFPLPRAPSKSAPPGPGYSPQSLSLLSWTQLYANLTKINDDVKTQGFDGNGKSKHQHFKYQVEYKTNNDKVYEMPDLTVISMLDMAEKIGRKALPRLAINDEDESLTSINDDNEEFEIETEAQVDSSLILKKKKKKKKKNRLWRAFVKRAFVDTKQDEELDDQFGW